ncbi:MAG TPA: HEAT repeat domain-containing protein, partial [Longimicrobiales bacterium]
MAEAETAVGVFTTDRELIIRSWDRWLEEATGIAEGDACGRPLVELFPEIEQHGLLPRLKRVVETGAVEVLAPAFHRHLIACSPRQPSAHFKHMQQHVTISPLRGANEVAGAIVTLEDVTARLDRERDLAAQLRSSDEAVRLRAAQALADEGGRPALLGEVLGDRSWRVRRAASGGLAQAEDDSAVELLISAIRDGHRDPGRLNAAVTALVRSSRDVLPR